MAIIGAFLSPVEIWLVALLIMILALLSLMGHALAHVGAARVLHADRPARLYLLPFGDAAQCWLAAPSPGREALIALSGPLSNLLLAGLAYLVWDAQFGAYLNVSMPFIGIFNAWLALVNLTPAFPLDGGRILRAIGGGLLRQPARLGRAGIRLGYTLAAVLFAWGIFLISQNARYSWATGGATILFGLLLASTLKLHPAWADPHPEREDERGTVRPVPILLAGLLMLALAGISACLLLTNNGVETPGVALSVEPMIELPAQYLHAHSGTFILTSVATQSPVPAGGWLLSKLTPAVKFLPPEYAVPNEQSPQQAAEEGYQMLYQSETTALAVGMRQAGYPASVTGQGVKVVSILPDSYANGVLQPGDVIVGLNGAPVRVIGDLTNPMQRQQPGAVVRLLIKRGQQQIELPVKLLPPAAPDNPPRIGITIDSAGFDASLPFPGRIVAQKITGGPSAGLMFTLGVYNALTSQDLTGGRRIAGTGTINPDGTVGPIGGVEEKVIAAEMAGAEYFLSPTENYAAALSSAKGIKVIKIASVEQAVAFLKNLPAR